MRKISFWLIVTFMWAGTSQAVTWTKCANEGSACRYSGTKKIRYGRYRKYVTKTLAGPVLCSNSVFGDPIPGVNKICQLSSEVVAPAPTPAPTPTPTPTPVPTPIPAPSSFTLGQRPFVATSSWNTPIPNSATYTRLSWPAATGYNYWVGWDSYSPAIHVAKTTDPLVAVSMPANWGYPAGTVNIRIPTGATGANGTDGEILMIEGNTIHNCWNFKRTSNTTATCEAYGRADATTGTGWGTKSPFLSAGIVAAGSSQMAGLLVEAETNAGEIQHALQIALDFSLNRPGHTGEAIAGDGSAANGISQEGERLAIPRSVAMPSGLSPLGQKVFRALQNYGAFNIDVAGVSATLRAQSNGYNGDIISALRGDMNKILPLLQKVN